MLYFNQFSLRRAYIRIYAHTSIHSLPDAGMANQLLRKTILIPTDVGNVSSRSEVSTYRSRESKRLLFVVLFLYWQLRQAF